MHNQTKHAELNCRQNSRFLNSKLTPEHHKIFSKNSLRRKITFFKDWKINLALHESATEGLLIFNMPFYAENCYICERSVNLTNYFILQICGLLFAELIYESPSFGYNITSMPHAALCRKLKLIFVHNKNFQNHMRAHLLKVDTVLKILSSQKRGG